MSVSNSIQRLKTRIETAFGECTKKGGTLPQVKNTTTLSECIASIPTTASINNQNKTITENGVYSSDTGFTGLGQITVKTPSQNIDVIAKGKAVSAIPNDKVILQPSEQYYNDIVPVRPTVYDNKPQDNDIVSVVVNEKEFGVSIDQITSSPYYVEGKRQEDSSFIQNIFSTKHDSLIKQFPNGIKVVSNMLDYRYQTEFSSYDNVRDFIPNYSIKQSSFDSTDNYVWQTCGHNLLDTTLYYYDKQTQIIEDQLKPVGENFDTLFFRKKGSQYFTIDYSTLMEYEVVGSTMTSTNNTWSFANLGEFKKASLGTRMISETSAIVFDNDSGKIIVVDFDEVSHTIIKNIELTNQIATAMNVTKLGCVEVDRLATRTDIFIGGLSGRNVLFSYNLQTETLTKHVSIFPDILSTNSCNFGINFQDRMAMRVEDEGKTYLVQVKSMNSILNKQYVAYKENETTVDSGNIGYVVENKGVDEFDNTILKVIVVSPTDLQDWSDNDKVFGFNVSFIEE